VIPGPSGYLTHDGRSYDVRAHRAPGAPLAIPVKDLARLEADRLLLARHVAPDTVELVGYIDTADFLVRHQLAQRTVMTAILPDALLIPVERLLASEDGMPIVNRVDTPAGRMWLVGSCTQTTLDAVAAAGGHRGWVWTHRELEVTRAAGLTPEQNLAAARAKFSEASVVAWISDQEDATIFQPRILWAGRGIRPGGRLVVEVTE
jgi:hypothetical protein